MSDNKQLTKQDSNLSTIRRWFETPGVRAQVTGLLAKNIDEDLFAAQCIVAANDPALADASPGMILGALRECAQIGLLPGRHHKQVAIIYRKGWGNNPPCVNVQPQWQGVKMLMLRDPSVKYLDVHLVHEKDEFSVDRSGATETVHHNYDPFDDSREFFNPDALPEGKTWGLRGGYVRATMTNGDVRYHFTSGAKIERNRKCSEVPCNYRSGKPAPWNTYYVEQATKTVLHDSYNRRFIVFDPAVDALLQSADRLTNEADGNDPSRIVDTTATEVKPRALAEDRVRDMLAEAEAAAVPPHDPETGEIASDPEGTQPHASSEQGEVDLPFSDEERNGSKKK